MQSFNIILRVFQGGLCAPSSVSLDSLIQDAGVSNNIPQTMPVVTAGASAVILSVCLFVVGFVSHKKRTAAKRRVIF